MLAEAGLNYGARVEMAAYHIIPRGHFELFQSVRFNYVNEHYSACKAVEGAGLRRKGNIVEVQLIACIESRQIASGQDVLTEPLPSLPSPTGIELAFVSLHLNVACRIVPLRYICNGLRFTVHPECVQSVKVL